MQTKVFIIPGLGDDMDKIGKFIETSNITTEIFLVGWRTPTPNPNLYFLSRLQNLIDLVKQAYTDGNRVVLIGASAGGSFVINVFDQVPDMVSLVINLSGRLTQANGPVLFPMDKYRITEPIFMESVVRSEPIIDNPSQALLDKFVAFVPLWDELVPIRSMTFSGARIKRIWSFEHILNILLAFTIYKKWLLKAISLS